MKANKYQSTRTIQKIKINDKTYYRVIYLLGKMVTEIIVFELSKNPKDKEVMLTEVIIDDVPEEERIKILSDDFIINQNKYDVELMLKSLEKRSQIMKEIAEEKINFGMKRKLMKFMEVAGHYFGFIYEEGMPYPKFYHLLINAITKEVYVNGVPPEILPALFELIAPRLFSSSSDLTVQIHEGTYARISKIKNDTAIITVVVAYETKEESKLELSMGFLLKEFDGNWFACYIQEKDQPEIEKAMKESFDFLFQDLSMKLFQSNQ